MLSPPEASNRLNAPRSPPTVTVVMSLPGFCRVRAKNVEPVEAELNDVSSWPGVWAWAHRRRGEQRGEAKGRGGAQGTSRGRKAAGQDRG